MTHHKDSMRRTHIRRSRPSKPAKYHPSTALRPPTTASGRNHISSNHQVQRPRQEEQAMMRSNCTAFSRALSMAHYQRCRPVRCRTHRASRRKSHNVQYSSKRTNSTVAASCTGWVSRRPSSLQHRSTTRCRSIGNDLAQPPRHSPPNSASHKPVNTTLQAKQVQLARQHPSSRDSNYPLNTSRVATRNLDNRFPSPIPVP